MYYLYKIINENDIIILTKKLKPKMMYHDIYGDSVKYREWWHYSFVKTEYLGSFKNKKEIKENFSQYFI